MPDFLKSVPVAKQYTVPPVAVVLLLLLVFILPEPVKLLLTYERDLIGQGQVWRLLTGQWVHWGLGHFVMNVAGVFLLWLLFAEYAQGKRYVFAILGVAMMSNLGMYLFDSQVAYYVGFSGTIYGLFAWGAVQDVRQKAAFGWLLLIGVCAKVAYDMFVGAVSLSGSEVDALAVSAHFYGVLAGGVLGLLQKPVKLA